MSIIERMKEAGYPEDMIARTENDLKNKNAKMIKKSLRNILVPVLDKLDEKKIRRTVGNKCWIIVSEEHKEVLLQIYQEVCKEVLGINYKIPQLKKLFSNPYMEL